MAVIDETADRLALGRPRLMRFAVPRAEALSWALFAVGALAFLIYVVVRAAHLSFTSDEAQTYAILHGNHAVANTANNQWLNTLLMGASQSVFGPSEFALRLPNVLAFVLYAGSGLVLLSKLRRPGSRLIGFCLLFVNPFSIEFFSLGRGYGLCMAFSTLGLALLMSDRSRLSLRSELVRLSLVGAAAALAFYSNFAALNLSLGLIGVAAVDVTIGAWTSAGGLDRRRLRLGAFVLMAAAATLLPGIREVHSLKVTGQLYFGGTDPVSSIAGSLVRTWFYKPWYYQSTWITAGQWLCVALSVASIVWSARVLVIQRRWDHAQRIAVVFGVMVLAAIAEATILGTLYPTDRTALTYLVVFGVLIAFVFDGIRTSLNGRRARAGLIALTVCVVSVNCFNFVSAENVTHTLDWAYDASSHRTIASVIALERRLGPPQHPWKLIAGWPRNYALTYYRTRLHLNWLEPITPQPTATPGGDIYDVNAADVRTIPVRTTLVAAFPETQTQLRIRQDLQ